MSATSTRRLSLVALALTASLWAPQAIGDSWLESMKQKKDCITGLENARTQYARVSDTWFSDSSSPFHLEARFSRLILAHAEYRKATERFARRYEHLPENPEAVANVLRELEKSHPDVLATYDRLNEADDAFVASVAAVDEAVAVVGDRFAGLQETCAASAAETVQTMLAAATAMRRNVAIIQGYVTTAGQKRGDLFLAVYHGLQIKLAQHYATLLNLPLKDAEGRLKSILLADAYLNRIQSWWLIAHGRQGLGEGLTGLWLQHQRPLAIMARDRLQGEQLARELTEHQSLPDEVFRSLQGELTTRMATLSEMIASLEARGPKGNLALQRETNARRRQILERYRPECGEAMTRFETVAARAVDQAAGPDYAASEGVYIDVVGACRRRNP